MVQEENPKFLLLSNMYVLNFTSKLAGVWFSLNYNSDYIDHLECKSIAERHSTACSNKVHKCKCLGEDKQIKKNLTQNA